MVTEVELYVEMTIRNGTNDKQTNYQYTCYRVLDNDSIKLKPK